MKVLTKSEIDNRAREIISQENPAIWDKEAITASLAGWMIEQDEVIAPKSAALAASASIARVSKE